MTATEAIERDRYEGARRNAQGWYESIIEMLDGLSNWQQAAEDAGWTGPHKDKFGATYFLDEIDGQTWTCKDWKELCKAHEIEIDYSHESEDGRRTIEESPLSVMVRDGWRQPGAQQEDRPEEFEILLSTGGPALRIWGTLNRGEPDECELQMQDWGVPWLKWAPEPYDEEYRNNLRRFASCFYYGD